MNKKSSEVGKKVRIAPFLLKLYEILAVSESLITM